MQIVTLIAKAQFETPEDRKQCLQVLEGERVAFNECAKAAFGLEKNSIVDLHSRFYEKFRKSHPEIPSQVAIIAQRACLAAYRSIKSNDHKITSPIVKKRLGIKLDGRTYSWKGESFKMTTLGKRILVSPIRYERFDDYCSRYEKTDPRVFERGGEIFIAYGFRVPTVNPEGTALGIDLGVRNFITTSEGNIIRDKEWLKRKRKARYLRRQLQAKAKTSQSARKHLRKMKRKEVLDTKDFCHRTSKKVLETPARVIVMEDLRRIKERNGAKRGSKSAISQMPLALFREILTYKALLAGKRVETVNPRFTSQTDHRTGRRTGERRGRRYIGRDGVVLDADVNAAINIAYRYVHQSANSKAKHPVLSCKGLDGQVVVNQPHGSLENQAPML